MRGNTPLPQCVEALILSAAGRGAPLVDGRAGVVRSAARLCSPDRSPLGGCERCGGVKEVTIRGDVDWVLRGVPVRLLRAFVHISEEMLNVGSFSLRLQAE